MKLNAIARFALLTASTLPAAAQAPIHTLEGTSGDALGCAVAFLPDVDGDGVNDFAVGSRGDDPLDSDTYGGSVKVHSGKTGARLFTVAGTHSYREFGTALAVVPDVNGDGLEDLLVGAPNDATSWYEHGLAYVVGSNDGVVYRTHGNADNWDWFGASVANIGDRDFDGVDDYAIGAPQSDTNSCDECGKFEIYSGATGALLDMYDSNIQYSEFGSVVAKAGDLDGDGAADLLVGAPGYVHNGNWSQGAVFVFLSSSTAPLVIPGRSQYEMFGASIASLGDLDGDTRPEFAVGAPYAGANNSWRGRVTVYDGATRARLFDLDGQVAWRLGAALANVGDYDADGDVEFAVGAPGYARLNAYDLGLVRVFEARSGATVATLKGAENNGDFGAAIAGGFDLNGDEKLELLVGAPQDNSFASTGGAAHLLLSNAPSPVVYGQAKQNSGGCTPEISAVSVPSLSLGDRFHIRASSVIQSAPAVLIWGHAAANTPFHGGKLLVAAPFVRQGGLVARPSGWICGGELDFHFTQALMSAHGLTAGTNVCAQFWYRDGGFAAPNNVGLTDAVRTVIAP